MLIFCPSHAGEFLVVEFRLESEFQCSNCLQHTAMMLVYGSDLRVLQEALCEALCRFAHFWSESLQKGAKPHIYCEMLTITVK